MSLSAILLGLINIAIWVAVFLLIGLIIVWFASWFGQSVPTNVRKMYCLIVALCALAMLIALLLGVGMPFRVVQGGPLFMPALV